MMTSVTALQLNPLTRQLKALGDETRLRMVALLAHGELCVCHLESGLELPQPTVSRHLGILRMAGLVEARRNGTWVFYRLAEQTDELCRAQLRALKASLGNRETLKRDVARLLKAKGPNSCQ